MRNERAVCDQIRLNYGDIAAEILLLIPAGFLNAEQYLVKHHLNVITHNATRQAYEEAISRKLFIGTKQVEPT